MKKNILFFSPYCSWPVHFETDLEIIYDHIEQKNEITFITCSGEIKTCEPNPLHFRETCIQCISRRRNGFNILELNKRVKFVSLKQLIDQDILEEVNFYFKYAQQDINSLEQLRNFSVEDADIGMGVCSSLIDYTREPIPDFLQNSKMIYDSLYSSLLIYFSVKKHLKVNKYHLLYIFNGRYAPLRAALRAGQSSLVKVVIHERAGVLNRYSLTYDTYPHDLSIKKLEIIRHWQASERNSIEKYKLGRQWFETRKEGRKQSWYSFTEGQNEVLPENYDLSKFNVVIFNSSEDEFAAIDGWENPFYLNQNDGLQKIAQDCADFTDTDFYLRIHPNLKKIKNSQTAFIEKHLLGHYSNFHVIPADSLISSYFLLNNCDLVITFGSTIGVEAAYARKPSILLGHSVYEDLSVCTLVTNHKNLIYKLKYKEVYLDDNELQKRYFNAIKYGYYFQTMGYPFKRFNQDDVFGIYYKGSPIVSQLNILEKIQVNSIKSYRKFTKFSRSMRQLLVKNRFKNLYKSIENPKQD